MSVPAGAMLRPRSRSDTATGPSYRTVAPRRTRIWRPLVLPDQRLVCGPAEAVVSEYVANASRPALKTLTF